jgi:hypothetical protein
LEALADAVVAEVNAWTGAAQLDKAKATRTPRRSLFQVGPVALSIAWLPPSSGDLGDGELLVAVWHGVIGVQPQYQFERVTPSPPPSAAREVWEEVLHPGVVAQDSWRWVAREQPSAQGMTGAELATVCVAKLRHAFHVAADRRSDSPIPEAR